MQAKFNMIIVALIAILFISKPSEAAVKTLSEKSSITLFTCGPGVELYAGFGHSALWISDPETGVDRLYNYGTFDFNTPNFYGKFVRGRLDYQLSVTNVSRFLAEYDYRKIAVTAQELNFTLEEKQRLYEHIENNALPENRLYRYDFFYDNCATRLRDMVQIATNGQTQFTEPDQNLSFRAMLFPYLTRSPWTKFGINLILGLSADKIATPEQYMYLPEMMQKAFASAQIGTEKRSLINSERKILEQRYTLEAPWYEHPAFFFSIILIVVLILGYFELKRKKTLKAIDNILFITSILAGLFLLFMWVGTDHSATNQNMNIIWLLPAQLLFWIGSFFDKHRKIHFTALISLTVFLVAMLFWPQDSELTFWIIGIIYWIRMATRIKIEA